MTDNEINELLATKVVGWIDDGIWYVKELPALIGDFAVLKENWSPITNISQAIECADKYADKYGNRYEEWSIGRFTNDTKTAYVVCINDIELAYVNSIEELPRAICLALVEAVKK